MVWVGLETDDETRLISQSRRAQTNILHFVTVFSRLTSPDIAFRVAGALWLLLSASTVLLSGSLALLSASSAESSRARTGMHARVVWYVWG